MPRFPQPFAAGGLAAMLALTAACAATPAGNASAPDGEHVVAASPRDVATLRRERQASRTLLERDARLQRRITVAWKDRWLGDALPELGKTIGVALTASAETADDKVSAFAAEQPAAELLSRIAELRQFRWRERGAGYRLEQTAAARREEEAWRARERAERLDEIERQVERILPLTALSPAERGVRENASFQAIREVGTDASRRREISRSVLDLGLAGTEGMRPALLVYQSLGPLARALLGTRGWLRLSTLDGSLSPPLADGLWEAVNTRAKVPVAPRPAQLDILVCHSDGPGVPGTHRLELSLSFVVRVGARQRHLGFVAPGPGTTEPDSGAVPPFADELLLKRIPIPPQPASLDPNARPWGQDLIPVSVAAEAIHRATGLTVVADSFARARLRPAEAGVVPGEGLSLGQLLDRLSQRLAFGAERTETALLLRSRTAPRERHYEPPERIVKVWGARVLPRGLPQLDELAVLAAALDDRQSRGLVACFGWHFAGLRNSSLQLAESYGNAVRDLRLWHALSPGQRRVARSPEGLPADSMSDIQRRLYVSAITPTTTGQLPLSPFPPSQPDPPLEMCRLQVASTVRTTRRFRQDLGGEILEAFLDVDPSDPSGVGTPPRFAPVGEPFREESCTFAYHCAGVEAPIRSVSVRCAP